MPEDIRQAALSLVFHILIWKRGGKPLFFWKGGDAYERLFDFRDTFGVRGHFDTYSKLQNS